MKHTLLKVYGLQVRDIDIEVLTAPKVTERRKQQRRSGWQQRRLRPAVWQERVPRFFFPPSRRQFEPKTGVKDIQKYPESPLEGRILLQDGKGGRSGQQGRACPAISTGPWCGSVLLVFSENWIYHSETMKFGDIWLWLSYQVLLKTSWRLFQGHFSSRCPAHHNCRGPNFEAVQGLLWGTGH